jgi:large subunit ribosomal protein L33
MAKKGNRQLVKVVNKTTGSFYVTSKNRVNTTDKLKIKKFDPKTKKHEMFEEGKLK